MYAYAVRCLESQLLKTRPIRLPPATFAAVITGRKTQLRHPVSVRHAEMISKNIAVPDCPLGTPGDRLTLRTSGAQAETIITTAHCERLQAISDEDAFAEGVVTDRGPGETWYDGKAREIFSQHWNRYHRHPAAWEDDPLVWVLLFQRFDFLRTHNDSPPALQNETPTRALWRVGRLPGDTARYEAFLNRRKRWLTAAGENFDCISGRLSSTAADWCVRHLPHLSVDEQRRHCRYPVPTGKRKAD